MKIYALYGKSGTGKSHRSSEVASRYQIDAVIDDGILIVNKIRVAGQSAKNERTMHAATKRAIFLSESHRQEVNDYIEKANFPRILVLGTSQKMIRKIVDRLDLEGEIIWIPIDSLQSEKELQLATERRGKGYHVIPIRPIEVEKTYYGSWFRKLIIPIGKKEEEATLVKALYLPGKITVQDSYIRDMVLISALPTMQIHSVQVEKEKVHIVLSMEQGHTIKDLLKWKEHVMSVLSYSMGISYLVDIEWRSIIFGKRGRGK